MFKNRNRRQETNLKAIYKRCRWANELGAAETYLHLGLVRMY